MPSCQLCSAPKAPVSCKGCNEVHYCSKRCQATDWMSHSGKCKAGSFCKCGQWAADKCGACCAVYCSRPSCRSVHDISRCAICDSPSCYKSRSKKGGGRCNPALETRYICSSQCTAAAARKKCASADCFNLALQDGVRCDACKISFCSKAHSEIHFRDGHPVRLDRLQKGPDSDNEVDCCVVCLDAKRTHALVPCGHLILCEECLVATKLCPVCREPARSSLRIYKP